MFLYFHVGGVAECNILDMRGQMSFSGDMRRERRRQLRINQEFHSTAVTTGWFISRAA